MMYEVFWLARDLDGRVQSRSLRASFVEYQRAIEYVRHFANDMLNWKFDFEIKRETRR